MAKDNTPDKTTEKVKTQVKQIIAEEYLEQFYEFRFNTVKGMPEYRARGENKYVLVDDYKLNSLIRELAHEIGLVVGSDTLDKIIKSDYSKVRDPFYDYFTSLPEWDYTDYIKDLCATVMVANNDHWYTYLKKWLIATVANALEKDKCNNHTCLVLTGGQGRYKTTWADLLCPRDLKAYLYTGKIKPNDKDAMCLLAECFLINIDDQLKKLNRQDVDDLKELITKPHVKYRRPYDRYVKEFPRVASFIATVNEKDFMTDPTGSRRFLPFEVINIDIDKAQKIEMDLVWAQAYFLYREGKTVYWFTQDDIMELNEHNADFQMITTEEQLILEYFIQPQSRKDATHFLQPAAIQSYLEGKTHLKLSLKKLGEAFTKLGFEKARKGENNKITWGYFVIKKDLSKVEAENLKIEIPAPLNDDKEKDTPF